MKKGKLVAIGSVPLGAKFIFRTAEILGPEYGGSSKPPYEGQVLTVVGLSRVIGITSLCVRPTALNLLCH